MPRKASAPVPLAGNSATSGMPTEVAVIAATPAPATITAPDAIGLFKRYEQSVSPMAAFQVTSNESYAQAGDAFTKIGNFMTEIETAFKPSKSAADLAHKNITALEGMFLKPAKVVKENLALQILSWRRKLEDERLAEQQRLQREAEAEAARQRAADQARINAENEQRLLEAELNRAPWETGEAVPEPELITLPDPAPVPVVQLPSNVPYIPGGPSARKKPFAGRVTDLRKLIIEAGKRAEAGDNFLVSLGILQVDQVKLNQLAREHQAALGEIIPGVEAFQDKTLARG